MLSVVADDLWMTYDDLKTTAVCQYKSPFPTIDPAQVHIVMWRSRPVRSTTHSSNIPAYCSAAVSTPAACNVSVPLTTTVASSVLPIPSVLPLPATVIPLVPTATNDQLLRACGTFATRWTQPSTVSGPKSAVSGPNRFTWCSVLSLPPVVAGNVRPTVCLDFVVSCY